MINTNLTKFKISSRPEDFSISKKKSSSIRSFHSSNILNNSFIHKTPLKDHSISFKGVSLSKAGKALKNFFRLVEEKHINNKKLISNIENSYGEVFGNADKEFFRATLNNLQKASLQSGKSFIGIDDKTGAYILRNRTIWNETLRTLAYPFVGLPRDIINYSLSRFDKLTGNKAGSNLLQWLNNKTGQTFQKRKDYIENVNLNNALNGMVETYQKIAKDGGQEVKKGLVENPKKFGEYVKGKFLTKLFDSGHKLNDPGKAVYPASIDRFLNRWESGMISAAFLSGDMYNLTRLMSDNDKEAKKESKIRLKQEIGRVGFTAALMLFSMNALKKLTNSSLTAAVISGAVSTLIAEVVGRKIAGKHILPISKEQVLKEIGTKTKKENKPSLDKQPSQKNTLSNSLFNNFAGASNNQVKPDENKLPNQTQNNPQEPKDKKNRELVFKAIAAWLAIGIVGPRAGKYLKENITKLSKYEGKNEIALFAKNKLIRPLADFKNNHLIKISEIKKEDLQKIIEKVNLSTTGKADELGSYAETHIKNLEKYLKDNEKSLAGRFKDVDFNEINKNGLLEALKKMDKDAVIPLGENKWIVNTLDSIFVAPVKFIVNTPGNIAGLASRLFAKDLAKVEKPEKTVNNTKNFIEWGKREILPLIRKTDNSTPAKIEEVNKEISQQLRKNRFLGNDKSGTASYPSNKLSNQMKICGSGLSSLFLITDNYNHVMVKTNGEDKDLAGQKAKERALQEVSRNIFSNYIVTVFNNCLKTWSNQSLINAGINTIANVGVYETFTRMAVGLPIKPSSREEIVALEKKNETKKGFAGAYFRFMSYVTGKKSLSARINKPSDQTQSVPKKINLADRKNNIDFSSTINNYVNSK